VEIDLDFKEGFLIISRLAREKKIYRKQEGKILTVLKVCRRSVLTK